MRIVTPFDHITEKIIGLMYRVHAELGGGFAEKVYENAMAMELEEAGLRFERQKRLEVFYRGHLVGEFVADLVVEDAVILELKAVKELDDEHRAQCINYLTCSGLKVGLLANFGKTLEFQRLLSRSLIPPYPT